MFSVNTADDMSYDKQRIRRLEYLASLRPERGRSARSRRRHDGLPDPRVGRRTTPEVDRAISSGRIRNVLALWQMGVDWPISECKFSAGATLEVETKGRVTVAERSALEFQCPASPFRQMVTTWDGKHTYGCCQGFERSRSTAAL